MIFILLTVITASGHTLRMRSVEEFETLDACEAFLIEDSPNRAALQQGLSHRLGQPVTLNARCVQVALGVAL